jgi:hypothetical protein
MNNIIKKTLLATVASAGVMAAVCLTPGTAQAQVIYVGGVPDAYVATTEPVYYGGRAHYWYNGHWAYRDGGAWRYYQSEPGYFRDYRARYPQGHWHYGRR